MYKTILLQKSKISDAVRLLFLTACLYFAAGNTQSGWLYYIIAIICGILLINLIISSLRLSGIVVNRALPPHPIQVGKSFTVELILRNVSKFASSHSAIEISAGEAFEISGPLPQCGSQDEMQIRDFNGSAEAFLLPDSRGKSLKFYIPRLPSQEEIRIVYTLKALKRGIFSAGTVKHSTNAPFGFITVSRYHFKDNTQEQDDLNNSGGRIKVYSAPIKLRIRNRRQILKSDQRKLSLKSSEGTLRGLHEYSEGEDIRHIHWMTSARLNKTVVKEFQQNKETERLLIIPITDNSLSLLTDNKKLRSHKLSDYIDNFIFKLLLPKIYDDRRTDRILNDLKKEEEETNKFFGFEELLCCLMTAVCSCSNNRGIFNIVFYNKRSEKLESISDLNSLKNALPEWSVGDNPFDIYNKEEIHNFYRLLKKTLQKNRFSRILVLSLSEYTEPIPCPSKFKNKIDYILFSPLDSSNDRYGIYKSFCRKIAALKPFSRSAELLDPTISPEKAAKKL